jgi:hypothetical protein
MLKCQWKSAFGIDCFGCGFQRSVKLLTEGDLFGSLQMYPALLPFCFTIIYTGLHINFKFKNGPRHIIVLFSATASIMLISYFYKLLL